MKYNRYATPKPTGRHYTDQEQELAQEIEKLRASKKRAEKGMSDAQSHYQQISKKFKNKPVTPEPPHFVRGNTHPDPVEYRRLLNQAAKHRADTGQDEKIKQNFRVDEWDTRILNAHLCLCQRIDTLKELIQKNDRASKVNQKRG